MNRSVLRRLLVPSRIAGALALVFALALLSPVAVAAQADARPTHIIIEPSQPVVVGQPVTLSVRLATTSGEAVGALANEVLELWINDQPDRRIRTDANGAAQIRVSTDLTVGPHRVRVIYRGSSALAGSEAGTELVILPAQLAVQTVPPIANVTFSLGGRQFTSGPDGVAHIEVDVPGSYELKVVSTDVKTSDTHATFSRWADNEFTETRQVILPNDELLQAGFDVSYRISWSYIDLDGEAVDPSRASVMTVKGTHGATQVFKKYEPQWLLGTRVVRLQGGLQEAKIQWGVENVIVDGANTVNRGQHRFYVKPGDRWPIQLLLYTADFAAADALFGFPVGSGFKLQYPDGEVRYFPSGPDRKITAAALARGQYTASVAGAPGYAPAAPVAVTRHQDVQLKVVTYFDLAVTGFILGSIALGLLFVGRPHLISWVPTPLRRRDGHRAPVWTTAVLLLILIGVPLLTGSYMLTVRPPSEHGVVIPAAGGAGSDNAKRDSGSAGGAAALPPLAGEPSYLASPLDQGVKAIHGGPRR